MSEKMEAADTGRRPDVLQRKVSDRLILTVYYSKADFFYEGQELSLDEKERSVEASSSENKKNDRFHGHFNTFF